MGEMGGWAKTNTWNRSQGAATGGGLSECVGRGRMAAAAVWAAAAACAAVARRCIVAFKQEARA